MRALIVALLGFAFHSVSWATDSENALPTLANLTVKLCGTSAYPPASWVTQEGHVEGVNTQVVRQMLNSLGVQLDTRQNSNWRRCLKEVELGNVDLLTGFRTEARTHYMTFLETPVLHEAIDLFFPVERPVNFNGWQSLAGLRVGVLMGDSFGDKTDAALSQYPSLEWVSSQDQNLHKLADNRLDVVPMGQLSGQLQIDVLGLTGQIASTSTDVSDYWYVGISKKSPLIHFLPELNQALAQLLSDPSPIPTWVEQYRAIYLESMTTPSTRKELP